MFLRRCERHKSGKRHTYWALVESYRTAKGLGSEWLRIWVILPRVSKMAGRSWARICKATMRHVGHSARSLIRHLHMMQARSLVHRAKHRQQDRRRHRHREAKELPPGWAVRQGTRPRLETAACSGSGVKTAPHLQARPGYNDAVVPR